MLGLIPIVQYTAQALSLFSNVATVENVSGFKQAT